MIRTDTVFPVSLSLDKGTYESIGALAKYLKKGRSDAIRLILKDWIQRSEAKSRG